MYCQNCGNQIDDNAAVCLKCGVPTGKTAQATWTTADRLAAPVGRTGLSILAGYLGLFSFIPFVGILAFIIGILAINGLKQQPDKHGHGRAWFGIILGAISTIIYAMVFAVNN